MHKEYWDAHLEAIRVEAVRHIVEAGGDEAKIHAVVAQAISRAVELARHRRDAADTAYFGPPD